MTIKGTMSASEAFIAMNKAVDDEADERRRLARQKQVEDDINAAAAVAPVPSVRSPEDMVEVPNGPGIIMTREKAERNGLAYRELSAPAEPTEAQIERVARAIFFESSGNDEVNEAGEDVWSAIGTKAEYWRDLARAALLAGRQP